ncbi:MAG: type II toxin-antitoxin system RelE/ParE family toxin [Pseudomonadota bacterium]
MARVRYTSIAEADLLELWLTIAEDNIAAAAADAALDSIHETAVLLSMQPEMGRARPELAERLQSFPTRTPYIIFYLAESDGVVVVRVVHHARDIDAGYFS